MEGQTKVRIVHVCVWNSCMPFDEQTARKQLHSRPNCVSDRHGSTEKGREAQQRDEERRHLTGPPGLSGGLTI